MGILYFYFQSKTSLVSYLHCDNCIQSVMDLHSDVENCCFIIPCLYVARVCRLWRTSTRRCRAWRSWCWTSSARCSGQRSNLMRTSHKRTWRRGNCLTLIFLKCLYVCWHKIDWIPKSRLFWLYIVISVWTKNAKIRVFIWISNFELKYPEQ